jgi:hypothetical protein
MVVHDDDFNGPLPARGRGEDLPGESAGFFPLPIVDNYG